MHRCFAEEKIGENRCVALTGDEAKHMIKVLRLRCGDTIEICDGSGMVYAAEISAIENQRVLAEITGASPSEAEPKIRTVLFQGLSKGTKMDLVIQKAVELGASAVVPVQMEFSVVRLDGDAAKNTRWQRIAFEAAKQCKRALVPQVLAPVPFSEAVQQLAELGLGFAAYEGEQHKSLKEELTHAGTTAASCGFLIGPEGGFSPKEVALLKDNKIPTVSLGKRILRTETAAVTLLSVVMYHFDELGSK